MLWSPQQDQALVAVDQWLRHSDQQVFRLFGYAGSGKTTLAQHFASNVEGTVLFGAYTGKAAHVLKSKGCDNARTIHSLIYHSKEKGRAHLKELESTLANLLIDLGTDHPTMDLENHPRVKDIRKLIEEERRSLSRPARSASAPRVCPASSRRASCRWRWRARAPWSSATS